MGLLLTERYAEKIRGVLGCYDRVVIQGTLPELCYAEGMTGYLYARHIRIFDYPRFAEPLREELRQNAERLATEAGIEIEFVRYHDTRKEKLIEDILQKRGRHPGLVHVLSAMERCATYKPWHDKPTGRTYLRAAEGKCLHYYFYFIDEELGLGYVRVPTWCPFRLQIYFNGHNWLATQLARRGIGFRLLDNAFVEIADWQKAQRLSDSLNVGRLHARLDRLARRFCPVLRHFGVRYHWSLMQVEYALDIVFKERRELQSLYATLTRTAIHTVKPEHVATFLGRRVHGNYQGELGSDFHTRIEGTRIKHVMGPVMIKMYDKFGWILRIETVTNDVSFFQHYRQVEQRDGSRLRKWAAMKKGIYSLSPLRELLGAANQRYLEFLSALDDPSEGIRLLRHLCLTQVEGERSYRGLNFFDPEDHSLLQALARGEFNISGFRNQILRDYLPQKSCAQVCRLIKRLRVHGLVRKVAGTYKYYLTKVGRRVILAGLRLRDMFLIPELARELTT